MCPRNTSQRRKKTYCYYVNCDFDVLSLSHPLNPSGQDVDYFKYVPKVTNNFFPIKFGYSLKNDDVSRKKDHAYTDSATL